MPNWWWTEPVFDRTSQDVEDRTKKGHLNASDWSRIENNIGNLARDIGIDLKSKEWDRESYPFPTLSDFSRIVLNLEEIRRVYPYIQIDTPPSILTWNYTNDAERILFGIKSMWDNAVIWKCFDATFDSWDSFHSQVQDWRYFETNTWCVHMLWSEFNDASRTWSTIDEEGFWLNA